MTFAERFALRREDRDHEYTENAIGDTEAAGERRHSKQPAPIIPTHGGRLPAEGFCVFCWFKAAWGIEFWETPNGVALAQTPERPAGSALPNLPSASLRCIPAPLAGRASPRNAAGKPLSCVVISGGSILQTSSAEGS